MAKSRRLCIHLILVLLSFFSLAAFAPSANPQPSLSPLPALVQAAAVTTTTIEITITEQGFSPPLVTVRPGSVVRWTNETGAVQQLESARLFAAAEAASGLIYLPLIMHGQDSAAVGSPPAAEGKDGSWQSGRILPGASFSRTFSQPGQYPYQPAGSPDLAGIIIVEPDGPQISATEVDFSNVTLSAGLATAGNKDGGLSWGDFNNDGCPDVLVNTDSNSVRTRLYRQQTDAGSCAGTFTDVTNALAPGLLANGNKERSAIWGDINNDGYLDFAVNRLSRIEIYLNKGPAGSPAHGFGDGSGNPSQALSSFSDPVNAACIQTPDTFNIEAMGWVDYDNDGDLDLMVDNHNSSVIFGNDGSGNLTDIDPGAVGLLGCGAAVSGDYGAFTDFDSDGDVDFLDRKEGQVDLWVNNGAGQFSPNGFNEEANTNNKGGAAFCDFDNDRDFDLFWTDNGKNQIWRQDPLGSFTATALPAGISGNIDDAACADIDNDGDLDLFLTSNGNDQLFINTSSGGTLSFIQNNRGITGATDGEGAAFADYDRDGDLDLLINQDFGNELWRNSADDAGPNNYLFVRALRDLGNGISRDALGATMTLLDCAGAPVSGIREVNGGRGHGAQDPAYVHFGLPAGPAMPYVAQVQFVGGAIVKRAVIPANIGGYQLLEVSHTDADDLSACEAGDSAQTGDILRVNTTDDLDDGVCGIAHCSLREAIKTANSKGETQETIIFTLGEGPQTIAPASALPAITGPVVIDAQADLECNLLDPPITLDGGNAGLGSDGLVINSSSGQIRGLLITGFDGDGLELSDANNNNIDCNTITTNHGAGVRISSGSGNTVRNNRIFENGQLGLDLGGEGITVNDKGDLDPGANDLQNFPIISSAFPDEGDLTIEGRLNSSAETSFQVDFFANEQCDPTNFGEGQTFLGTVTITTNENGNSNFSQSFTSGVPEDSFITAMATDEAGNSSEFSQCIPVSLPNDTWPRALRLSPNSSVSAAEIDQYIDRLGQSRWYKFSVKPGSQVIVTLTNLPANYDLTVYKDIATAFDELISPQDLVRLNAEFAPDAFAADAFAAGARSPDAFAAGARSPDAFATGSFSPDAFAAGARSPDAFAAGARSPDAFAAGARSPDVYAPDAFSPDAFAAGARSPEEIAAGARSPEAYSSAQTRSLIAISAFEGTTSEGIIANTWNNTGDFYVRVRGRDGAFSLDAPFHLEVTLLGGACNDVAPLPVSPVSPGNHNFKTIILTDLQRMVFDPANPAEAAAFQNLQDKLAAFASRPEVRGVVVDVHNSLATLNGQADSHFGCPYAKNLVAEGIKGIINSYRANENPDDPIEYIVLIGNDSVIPFFRYPDNASLGPESDYIPPVGDFTSSQASLRLNYVLGQDAYGSKIDLSLKSSVIPVPDLAVGRLVESPLDITRMLDVYLNTAGGIVTQPTSALVTGYDFMEDAAQAIQAELEEGLNQTPDSLIAPRDASPQDLRSWTADQLRTALLGSRHDLIFLGGHFSANSALAADYQTRLLASELAAAPVNLEQAIVFSIGCHSGYNIVNQHGIPGVTREPDWVQAFAQKGATLIAGTGYQYGDTDFIEYSERLYLEFSRQLRTGAGPVAVGRAMVAAKQAYLAQTPQLRDLHEKSFLEATIFGLPMLSVNMPGNRLSSGGNSSVVTSVNSFNTDPGDTLELKYADIQIDPLFSESTVQLKDIEDGSTIEALYLAGRDGVVTNPGEPVLPLELRNVSGPGALVLRGVGFRGADYSDRSNVLPLSGAATTEIRGIHTTFLSDVFFPIQPWNVNYFDALVNGSGGATSLAAIPAQFKSAAPGSDTGTLRRFNALRFRLYYSNNIDSFGDDETPALAAPPAITGITAIPEDSNITFKAHVVGDPAAGIQEVWVLSTVCPGSGACNGTWQPLDLAQSSTDSTLWQKTVSLSNLGAANAKDVRYLVQAVNGVGLVSLATNLGAYYIPGLGSTPTQPAALSLEAPASTSGPYGSQASFSAILSGSAGPLEGRLVAFQLGSQTGVAVTNDDGRARVTLPLLGLPGSYEVKASFAGTSEDAPATATNSFNFEITKQTTSLCLEPPAASNDDLCQAQPIAISGQATEDPLLVATLKDGGNRRLVEQTVFFIVTGSGGSYSEAVITDYLGRAPLGNIPLPPGSYSVTAYYNGQIPKPGGGFFTDLDDQRYLPASSIPAALTLVSPPPPLDCSTAKPSIRIIWPADLEFITVNVLDITDQNGNPTTITINSIFQDEPVGKAPHSPDGKGIGTQQAQVRAERDGTGNGRVYHIRFDAADGNGGLCSGKVRVAVHHDQGVGIDAIDDGPLYDSTKKN